jgi:hypothetical protein
MPLTAVFNVKPQTDGVTHANRDQGGPLVLPEVFQSNYSPAFGVVPTALTGDFRAGAAHPASVFGTGDNPDRLVLTGEAV